MEKFVNFTSSDQLQSLTSSLTSSLDVPSFQSIILLIGVFFYLITSLFFSFIFSNLTFLLRQNEPTALLLTSMMTRLNQLTYWTGLSSGCFEALVCSAGKSMDKDFPNLSTSIKTLVDRIIVITMDSKVDHYTQLFLEAMSGQGQCFNVTSFDCPIVTSTTNSHGTEVVSEVASTIYSNSVSRIAWIATTFITAILTTFISGFLFMIMNRKSKRYQKVSDD